VWIPFQSHHFSENLVAPGIEPVTSGSDHLTTGVVSCFDGRNENYFLYKIKKIVDFEIIMAEQFS
jgi:hypothetical protein